MPRHGTKLFRDGGYYNGHVYFNMLVESTGRDDVVTLTPLDGAGAHVLRHPATGGITTESPNRDE